MSLETFRRSLKDMTKEEKTFLSAITKLMDESPYSLRAVLLVDARDDDRSDLAGIITGCCHACATDLVMSAANAIVQEDVFADGVVLQ